MNDLIADVFEFLRDGHWHARRDVEQSLNMDMEVADQIIEFLVKFGLLKSNADGSEIMMDLSVLSLLTHPSKEQDVP